ncbi:hypothetical protein WJX73_003395 [Symbiochloris irregularis]|uniref:Uncharacterized protein n=1 Tax=Symbiochloris irregularis TaxID=706552 RepID=A0AAW1NVF8_9CHLO
MLWGQTVTLHWASFSAAVAAEQSPNFNNHLQEPCDGDPHPADFHDALEASSTDSETRSMVLKMHAGLLDFSSLGMNSDDRAHMGTNCGPDQESLGRLRGN